MRAETRSVAMLVMACVAAGAIVVGVIRGNDAESAIDGVRLVFSIDFDAAPRDVDRATALAKAVTVIRDRIDEKGVASPSVTARGEEIVVELFGLDDEQVARVVDVLQRMAKLSFVVVDSTATQIATFTHDHPDARSSGITVEPDVWTTDAGGQRQDLYLRGPDEPMLHAWLEIVNSKHPELRLPDGRRIAYQRVEIEDLRSYWRTYVLDETQQVDGASIADAKLTYDPTTGSPQVLVTFDAAGKVAFGALTRANVGNKLAIVLDGRVKSAPIVQGAIEGGEIQVTMGGNDAAAQEREAQDLITVLRTGSLPGPMVELSRASFSAPGGSFLARSWMFFALAAALIAGVGAWYWTTRNNSARAANPG